jgi:hypothetical protein
MANISLIANPKFRLAFEANTSGQSNDSVIVELQCCENLIYL